MNEYCEHQGEPPPVQLLPLGGGNYAAWCVRCRSWQRIELTDQERAKIRPWTPSGNLHD